ncbi:Oxoglutarate/iron-dependent dioxygenase [Quillaja saponaria]|uniref:Oxoglutarate/iron-dependent dioxygenase n=1 Tax=Quillaja saponaria TaxID=32244 RepID=A0AAD7Q4X7_QUISA|nr:Oxoglutarate/iron-dependent dioxygenase [Quillaja saponaria]
MGFFQIVNHGICQLVLGEAMSSASNFFNLPNRDEVKFMSSDVHKPVRYGTSFKDGVDKVQFWRIVLKHYAHPSEDWIHMWPDNPSNYSNKMEDGMQVMAVNCYHPCPQPEMALGLPPHSDYSCITILQQNYPGLEIMDMEEGMWGTVPELEGALQVHVGDHLEVLSNGLYKSVVHRVTLNSERTRISIASLHSLGMDEKMETAKELVDEQHPKKYKESSFRDFVNFLATNEIAEGNSFINSLKINNN